MYPNWINKDIDKSILQDKFLKVGFSQYGEDEFIRHFFWHDILKKRTSHYLDIGCFDEAYYSNTKLLNLCGWSGIAVDANPDAEARWKSRRPSDHFYNLAIKDEACSEFNHLELFRFHDGAINTIQKEVAKDWIKRGFPFKDTIKVKCLEIDKLAELITKKHPNFKPEFVNIDIEQCDYLPHLKNFLEVLDHPKLLCIEWVCQGFDLYNFEQSRESRILQESNYRIKALINGSIMAAREQ